MKDVIHTNLDSCFGCNRCVRECPMELANITYQDEETGAIKVSIDYSKCINCGRCISVCKHNSRVYVDDTQRFFDDLLAGVPISVIAAPSIRTNMPDDYRKLFTYLKQLGVNKIYDVSLGADICIWAHVRHIERTKGRAASLITQPCPVIVSYCEVYKPQLLKYLSPIQSPMACIAIYMKNVERINTPIAALSPCLAKSDEFADTGLTEYNVTFAKLMEYLKRNNITLPESESDFDGSESGLGSIFPMPGGLKENISVYFGGDIHTVRAEGFNVFRKLDEYAATDESVLPEVFDVLNCVEGCNMGSACEYDRNIFEIDSVMWKKKKAAQSKRSRKRIEKLYREYDRKFKLDDFYRKYREVQTTYPHLTDAEVEKAFAALGKSSDSERNFDCGACGSDSCYGMARKIAVGVNIPINCIVKDMQDLKHEHEKNLLANEQLQDTAVKLEIALKRAEAESRAKGDFLSAMSHEMRTPMNAIIGMTAIGKRAASIDEKNLALKKINDASSHLLGVINDILDMAKIEADKLELIPIEYNFERLLQKVLTVIRFRADEKQQTLTVNIGSKIPRFMIGDDQRLSQVIINLLSNAVKFTPEGGSIRFDATFVEKENDICELQMEISDNGIGISAKQQKKLFKAFQQAESGTSRKYGGTGLGLIISKNIVELMGGSIRVESELGKGARFIFYVQVRRGEKNPRSLLAPGVNWETVRILVADDSAEVREQFCDIFNELGIKCDVAFDGIDAEQKINERGDYDIYFVDWRMPRMDGIELTRHIKTRRNSKPSVVIMITAMDWEIIRSEALDAGVNRHLLKPLFSSTVIDCVNECLGIPRKQRKNGSDACGEFTGKRMLLAEDIEVNREILIALLENSGISIDCVENGLEALNIIAESPRKYDIVFMDVQMPIMDGLEATGKIRALPQMRNVNLPIIAMTANVFKSDIEACIAAGMDEHLGKPVDIDKVLEVLRKYL